MDHTEHDSGGCAYGRGNRWGIGIIVALMALVTLANVSINRNARVEIQAAITRAEAQAAANTKKIQDNREIVVRMDERLRSIADMLERLVQRSDQEAQHRD